MLSYPRPFSPKAGIRREPPPVLSKSGIDLPLSTRVHNPAALHCLIALPRTAPTISRYSREPILERRPQPALFRLSPPSVTASTPSTSRGRLDPILRARARGSDAPRRGGGSRRRELHRGRVAGDRRVLPAERPRQPAGALPLGDGIQVRSPPRHKSSGAGGGVREAFSRTTGHSGTSGTTRGPGGESARRWWNSRVRTPLGEGRTSPSTGSW